MNQIVCVGFSRGPLLTTLLKVFELPEDTSTPDDEHFIEIEDTPGILLLIPVKTLIGTDFWSRTSR